ncbi:unnamed protein product [Amoebophrya sp. A25]|nr:unnamed protein product [Amoebophrya sp. A25]|eukprot:GSA25T00015609001.1
MVFSSVLRTLGAACVALSFAPSARSANAGRAVAAQQLRAAKAKRRTNTISTSLTSSTTRRNKNHVRASSNEAYNTVDGVGSDNTSDASVDAEGFSTLTATYPFYHTTNQIHSELLRLQAGCNGWLSVDTQGSEAGPSVDVVSVRKPNVTPTSRFFLLFGEHARELISAESGFHFLKTLCGETNLGASSGMSSSVSLLQKFHSRFGAADASAAAISSLLDTTEFRLVVNGNPDSRKRVERGEFCLRVNGQSVDLNRNWDLKWEPSSASLSADTNPGPHPFSETETKIFRDAVKEFQPTAFLTIHSGTRGMYMPWAYNMVDEATRNGPTMLRMIKELDQNYCKCPFGAAGKEVGYSCPGTCLDYVYDKLGVDYSFAFEIYSNPADDAALKSRYDELASSSTSFIQVNRDDASNALGADAGCFMQFNPQTQDNFAQTVENWTRVYLRLAQLVEEDVTKKHSATGEASHETGGTPSLVESERNSIVGDEDFQALVESLRNKDTAPMWRP